MLVETTDLQTYLQTNPSLRAASYKLITNGEYPNDEGLETRIELVFDKDEFNTQSR